MDSLITAAARALAAGDPLGALNRVALRDDAPALALRGIAMAQLGDFDRARALLRRGARAFGPKEPVARARCVVAEAEIALVSRDLGFPAKALDAARAALEQHGDRVNAAHARYLEVAAPAADRAPGRSRAGWAGSTQPPSRLHRAPPTPWSWPGSRCGACKRAGAHGARPGRASRPRRPHPRTHRGGRKRVSRADCPRRTADGARRERLLRLDEVEALLASPSLVVDACRHVVRDAGTIVSLTQRPVLFALARTLAEAWPGDVTRGVLLARAFGAKHADELHRARLRVEIGRLRAALRPLASVIATKRGFALCRAGHPRSSCWRARSRNSTPRSRLPRRRGILVELRPGAGAGCQSRTVQRSLDALAAAGKVQPSARAGTPLDDPAAARLHDDVIIARIAAGRLAPGNPASSPLPRVAARRRTSNTRCATPLGSTARSPRLSTDGTVLRWPDQGPRSKLKEEHRCHSTEA